MQIKHKVIFLTVTAASISFIVSILLSATTFVGAYAFSFIPFSFLLIAAAALAEKNEYKPASFFAMLGGFVTFPIGGFLGMWGGFYAYRYNSVHTVKFLTREINVRPELVVWIQRRLDRGYMEDYIRHVLYIHGYKREIVDAAFRKLVSG